MTRLWHVLVPLLSPSGLAVLVTCGGLAPALNRTACDTDSGTCCTMGWMPNEGHWGCCALSNAVCCSNGYTCCPAGTECRDFGKGYSVTTTCVPVGASGGEVTAANSVGEEVCKTADPVVRQEGRPLVLIIGDSVSIGYTPYVRAGLKDIADVAHGPWDTKDGGAEESEYGWQCIEYLLHAPNGSLLQPDVIMFNWGLHNENNASRASAHFVPGQSGPASEYAPYLTKLAMRIKVAAPKVLFAITSPEMCSASTDAVIQSLNTQAIDIMRDAEVPTVDLHAAITRECGQAPNTTCLGHSRCFCPHCPLGYEWLARGTLIPALRKLLSEASAQLVV